MKESQTSPHFPNCFYRVTAKGLCVRDGKVLLVHDFTGRSSTDPRPEWELPGGGLDFGESFHDAIRREVQEEMGLAVSSIEDKPRYVWTTRHPSGRGMDWYWVCTVIFRIEFENLDFTPSDECREIRWFSKEELQENSDDLATQIKPLVEAFNPEEFL